MSVVTKYGPDRSQAIKDWIITYEDGKKEPFRGLASEAFEHASSKADMFAVEKADEDDPKVAKDDNKIEKSDDEDDLEKGGTKGEGSRGGHVIGHTKSGDPVYYRPVDYKPSKYLNEHEQKIESEFGKHLNDHFDFAKKKYHEMFGNIINTDNARELSHHYSNNRSLSSAVHEPASTFTKKLYNDMLKELVPEGKSNMVLFTAGGTGSGKTTGLKAHGLTNEIKNKAHIIFDTNTNKLASAIEKIDRALEAGKSVTVIHTFRDPMDSFANGAIPRAIRMEKELGSGRTVPIGSHVSTHIGSNEAIPKMKEHYGDKVQFRIIDNSRGKGKSEIVPIEFLNDKKYNAEKLEKELNDHIDKLYEQGGISERLYRGFKAKGD